jgi:predicted RecB family nuclease
MKMIDGHVRLSASDVSNFLACRYLTRLDLLAAHGRITPKTAFDIGFDKLVERGQAHEATVLERYRADGLEVVEIVEPMETEATRATREVMGNGAGVIYQGVLGVVPADGGTALLGRPDFLVRRDLLPGWDGAQDDGQQTYEVVDAKLARTAKARAVLQATFYSSLLTEMQGAEPRRMHLALGNGEFSSFRVADFSAYERQVRRLLSTVVAGDPRDNPPLDPYPEPVEHCAICRWSSNCSARRITDDDLSLIAGMPTSQRVALKGVRVKTLRDFAALSTLPVLGRANPTSLARSQLQAQLQVASKESGTIEYRLLEPERDHDGAVVSNRGLLALPEPCVGDLFFDIEGSRYYSEDGREFGLQYLFGIVDSADINDDGLPQYTPIWAFDRKDEKRAFEELVDFITVRRERNPGLHVYHYNHYEPTSIDHLTALHETREEAVGRLMGRFATREDEVDDLFRLGVFVDLYRVVRQALRAGVQSYSIKRLEPLVGYERRVNLHDATIHLIAVEAALDEGRAVDHGAKASVAGYNEDDCRATLALRDWLEARRPELSALIGTELPRPEVNEEAHGIQDPDTKRLKAELLAQVPEDVQRRTDQDEAKVLLADLLEWHRREAKPAWWRFFRLRELSSGELVNEPDALGELSDGRQVGEVARSVIRRFSYPPQEHGFSVGDMAIDAETGKVWTVQNLDNERGTIDLRIGKTSTAQLPTGLVESVSVNTDVLAERLGDLGQRALWDGLRGDDPATALLLKRRPNGDFADTGPLCQVGEASTDAVVRLISKLHHSYLPVQGPPGTGKTYSGAQAILKLVSEGRVVGITAPSHAVIHNLLSAVAERAGKGVSSLRIGQHAGRDNPFLHPMAQDLDYPALVTAINHGDLDIVAGTAWMWARQEFASSVDALFVDEAGQMSLANVLAVAGAGRNLVLLGDPQQLAQPSQATHPPGAGVSALEHILGTHATIPNDAGLFLDQTHRMHPRLRSYTSAVFYDGRLEGVEGLERQGLCADQLAHPTSGLRVVEVAHEGNTNASSEEAAEVVVLMRDLLACHWTDKGGVAHPMTAQEVLVVTPYNAQIREIASCLIRAGFTGTRVGTVDKFQGREAPVVIYSMATSSATDAPRGLEFLFNRHRLNVATSRARALSIIIASPDLVRVFCGTPRQMQLVNALCRAWEWGKNDPT